MRVAFMGTPEFAVASLDAICRSKHEVVGVVTVPDRPSGRGLKMNCSDVKRYAEEHGLPLLQPEKLRDPSFLDALRTWDADIFVVVAFRMLPQCVWAMPRLGTFNLHASLLPQYRGAAPINWAIINGETTTGVTTFMLNERIDEGAILMQRSCEITPDDNAGTLHDKLAEMGKSLVVETLDGLESGTLNAAKQNTDSPAKPAPKIFKSDCAIPWNKSGKEIRDFVRGLSPYPAAIMSMSDGQGQDYDFKVYDVAFEEGDSVAGSIKIEENKRLKIGINDGYIEILTLQISGKKKNTTSEFLRGHNIIDWKLKY